MKIAIIGAGNIGGAIARGLAKGTIIQAENICVSNPSQGKLDALKAEFPHMQVTHSNAEAVEGADIVLLAVKPWFIEPVIKELPLDAEKQILISVAAGISFEQYEGWVGEKMPVFRIIPNTAISQLESMTLIASFFGGFQDFFRLLFRPGFFHGKRERTDGSRVFQSAVP